MCTAVDGGSIHRAARRISAASDQTSTTPITSHRTKDRRKPLRSGVLGGVSGFSVTLQNTSLGSVAAHACSYARTRRPAFSLVPKALGQGYFSLSCQATDLFSRIWSRREDLNLRPPGPEL